MPLKMNVGLSRKVGEPNYGSRGASVNLEMEVDTTLVTEPGKLQERIRQLFTVVRASLSEELNPGNGNGAHKDSGASPKAPAANGNGHSAPPANGSSRPATQSQVRAILAIAKRQQLDLPAFLKSRFQIDRPDALSLKEASATIDELKSADVGDRRRP